ncbi:TPA: hypothetical protein ACF3XO_004502 [Vibrio parahaemolyticus]
MDFAVLFLTHIICQNFTLQEISNSQHIGYLTMKIDYSVVMGAIKEADQDFTAKHGCGAPYQEWDAALEQSVREYNKINGTHFDPVEARHQYIEEQEAYLDSPKGKKEMAELVAATKK